MGTLSTAAALAQTAQRGDAEPASQQCSDQVCAEQAQQWIKDTVRRPK